MTEIGLLKLLILLCLHQLLIYPIHKIHRDESYEWGISKADVSTGELITLEGQSLSKLFDEIIKLDSSEIIVGSNTVRNLLIKGNSQITYTVSQETRFLRNSICNLTISFN